MLRHTALRKAAGKEDIRYAMKLSGHTSSKYIWRYTEPSRREQEQALEECSEERTGLTPPFSRIGAAYCTHLQRQSRKPADRRRRVRSRDRRDRPGQHPGHPRPPG